jgi:hypothetical protein
MGFTELLDNPLRLYLPVAILGSLPVFAEEAETSPWFSFRFPPSASTVHGMFASDFVPRQSLARDHWAKLHEAVSIRRLPLVVPKCLLINITRKMELFREGLSLRETKSFPSC